MRLDMGLALFTYCRPYHTQKVLESLKHNHFEKLYIFQDGLKNQKDKQAWEEVSQIINSVDFINTEVHISKENKGLANSIIAGVNYVLERHETVIALEDDIVLGKGYSRFMEECFRKYRDDKKVTCIAGGGWPVDAACDYEYDVFFSYRSSSIAWGTWRDRWKLYKRDFGIVQRIMKDDEKKNIYEKCGGDISTIMKSQLFGECDSWAVFWSLLQVDLKGVCVVPVKYLAQDIGHDGEHGTNSTFRTTRYDTELHNLEDNDVLRLPDNVFVDDYIMKQIKMVLDVTDSDNRKKVTERLLMKWIDKLHRGDSICKTLEKMGIASAYIYGAGEIAQKVIDEINSEIRIKGILVHDKNSQEFCGYPVYDFYDNIEAAHDNIIVIPVHDMEYIEYSMKKKFHVENLINLEDILES